ncbi:MAG: bifunctional precorrin-2 dehydrogenase/sirohydrochlorin ferrochelatase [Lachnospiraceae bacterium]|nr:bifunctional precorrin-2 dehydrogenase/sirohydrochlorin ferrochelatase [Lachnospiraceae bacterium]
MAYFPLMVEIEGRTVIVIGGGKVALHKIKVLLPFGVNIRVISEEFCDSLQAFSKENTDKITLIRKSFEETDILLADDNTEVCFVVAATDDDKLQSRVSVLCREKHIPVNVVDVKDKSTFYFPAITKRDDLVVAVSTGGNSPAAAGYIKERIADTLPDYYGRLVETLGNYRELVLSRLEDYDERKRFFRELLLYGEAHDGELPETVVMEKLSRYDNK